mmetsp:Transcript_32308/g.55323  ORF Transcript_32308/g.55323 Transcript_32308/m.55323 type:complete len:92 (+) Transcript_32308:3592-3867(+)
MRCPYRRAGRRGGAQWRKATARARATARAEGELRAVTPTLGAGALCAAAGAALLLCGRAAGVRGEVAALVAGARARAESRDGQAARSERQE